MYLFKLSSARCAVNYRGLFIFQLIHRNNQVICYYCIRNGTGINMSIKLSVIIPCYNGADTLAEQLDGLSIQDWDQEWEIIFADNRSTDNSRSIAEEYQQRLPNLRIIDASERQGQPFALNAGALAAKGESIAFADADDVVAPGWLQAMGNALLDHNLVACRWDTETLNPEWMKACRGNGQYDGPQEIWYPPYLPHAGGGSIGVNRKLHFEIGGFDEAFPYLHDTDYVWKAQLLGNEIFFVPEAVMKIRFRNDLKSIYRQTRNYAEYNVLLSKRYRSHGEPIANPWKQYFKNWYELLTTMKRLRRGIASRAAWIEKLAWQMGRTRGIFKHRVPPV